MPLRRVRVVDSHTEGEPTRVVVEGGPDLGAGSARERLERFRSGHDGFRRAVVVEPRGFDALVGAYLCEPSRSAVAAQVLFFNNVGPLGMCVHGTIGVAETLRWLGRLGSGTHLLETPVGEVSFTLLPDGGVEVENVRSYRSLASVSVRTDDFGTVVGDVAWGGNWFFLISEHALDLPLDLAHADRLTDFTWAVRRALAKEGIRGDDGGEIDHIEVFGPPGRPDADSRNFVLCPGRQYDRSPCGTGTSAKMACLFADGRLLPGQAWRQESLIGSRFQGSVRPVEGGVIPTIRGRAWITAESSLVFTPDDPFGEGIPS